MILTVIFPILLSTQLPSPRPGAITLSKVQQRLKAEALNPERLKAEGSQAKGCREDVEGTFTGRFTGYKGGHFSPLIVGTGRHEDPDGILGMEVHTYPVKAFIIPPDANVMLDSERVPQFVEIEARIPLEPFSVIGPSEGPLAMDRLSGRVVILYFFNPRCPYTQTLPEIIRLQSLDSKYAIQVLPVAIGIENSEAIERFRSLNPKIIPPGFRIFRMGGVQRSPRSVFKDFTLSPTTFILDRRGRVAWRICGDIPGALTAKVNHILSEPWRAEPGERMEPTGINPR